MAVACGIGPAELVELDGEMYEALERALGERWTKLDELVASLLERFDAFVRFYLAVHTKKGTRLPPPLVVPRPGIERPPAPRISPREFAASYAPKVKVSGR